MLKYLLNFILFATFIVSPIIHAHGVHQTHAGISQVAHSSSLLDFLIPALNAKPGAKIYRKGDHRFIESDGLPDHASGRFPNTHNPHAISEQTHKFRVPLNPDRKRSPTFIGHSAFGVALNGIPFDPATAEYWNNDRKSGWNIDAMTGGMDLGLDMNNAHVQPGGAYHYHSVPVALMERGDQFSRPVMLGYAADGFAIYGPYSYKQPQDMNSELINMFPSYRLREGERTRGPKGKYDGTYTADYEYVKGLGDLDQCNGRRGVTPEYPQGTYYYVITDSWPFIPRCWMGTADASFRKSPPAAEPEDEPDELAEEQETQAKPKQEKRRRIDSRRYGMPARDPVSACEGMRSGAFCSFRTRDMRTIQGTCRSNGASLICREIGR